MTFDLPTKQPTKTKKKVVLEAIDTDEQPLETPKKKITKKTTKKKVEAKKETTQEDVVEKTKAIGAILDAFDVDKAIEEPTFFVQNSLVNDSRTNRLNISMTPSQREKLMRVARAGLGNIALAFSCILNAFDVEEALKTMEK